MANDIEAAARALPDEARWRLADGISWVAGSSRRVCTSCGVPNDDDRMRLYPEDPPYVHDAGCAWARLDAALAAPTTTQAPGWVRPSEDIERWAKPCVNGPETVRALEGAYGQGWVDCEKSHAALAAPASGAVEEIRAYAVEAAATCRRAESERAADIAHRAENHAILTMLREQHFAWGEKAKSYDALVAFIDGRIAAERDARGGKGA